MALHSFADLTPRAQRLNFGMEKTRRRATTIRRKRILSHGRYVILQMAEIAVPKELFHENFRLIDGMRTRPVAP